MRITRIRCRVNEIIVYLTYLNVPYFLLYIIPVYLALCD
ncbi:hypothetical protein PIIN_10421 [Serendipita indica DSM 11827]|uniref:Uncharacterized protein n=1 Tax=Serendipita indica (strain DSM 11827) TaxID=1109443 RepID=G4TYN5_SERID|nr:hypothetical protein PIIN_10421 [Serendipita indica DSM 11827]